MTRIFYFAILLSLLHLSSCAKERISLLQSEINSSFDQISLLVKPRVLIGIKSLLFVPNSSILGGENKIIKAQLRDIYFSTPIDKLEILSDFFYKLLEFLQLSLYTQVHYRFNPDYWIADHLHNISKNPKVANLDKNCNWVLHALKVVNLIKLCRSLPSPTFSNELTFEKIFDGDFTNEAFGLSIQSLRLLLSKKRFLTDEEKTAFKTYLLFYKNYFYKWENWIIKGLNPDLSDLNGSFVRSQPYVIEGIIHSYRINEN
jgi:hypothetical protein